jgi:hypothetical protein
VRFKSKASPRKLDTAGPGKAARYKATIKNVDKRVAVQGLTVTVQLPATGASYTRSQSSRAYILKSPAHQRYRMGKEGLTAVVNYTSSPQTVTWHGIVLPPRKSMHFSIKVRTDQAGIHPGMALVFRGSVSQELPVNGLPYCSSRYVNETVVIVK